MTRPSPTKPNPHFRKGPTTRLLIDDTIELNSADEKRWEKVLADLAWLGKHAPDVIPAAGEELSTASKASEAYGLITQLLGEIKSQGDKK